MTTLTTKPMPCGCDPWRQCKEHFDARVEREDTEYAKITYTRSKDKNP